MKKFGNFRFAVTVQPELLRFACTKKNDGQRQFCFVREIKRTAKSRKMEIAARIVFNLGVDMISVHPWSDKNGAHRYCGKQDA